MSDYLKHLEADRRLVILRLLVEAGGECGESAIERGLHLYGHRTRVTRDVVRADLKALKERDCLEIEYVDSRIMVACITQRGVACSKGAINIEGVAEPMMGR